MASRTLELYGFVKGDPSLVSEGMRVRVLDKNLVDRTDLSETFLVQRTASGLVYKVKAKGDLYYDTPTDTKTGLYDEEEFYIVFQEIGSDKIGQPARTSTGILFTYKFVSSIDTAINVDLHVGHFPFQVSLSPGSYVNRQVIKIQSDEPGASFLVNFTGQEPIKNDIGVTELLDGEPITIPRDGQVVMKVAAVDQFGNVAPSESYVYNIEYPNTLVLEAVTLEEIKTKRYFYPKAYLINADNTYTEISKENLDLLIVEANSDPEALSDIYYVPLEPGVNSGVIHAPRFVKLASNRQGVLQYETIVNNKLQSKFKQYTGETLQLSQGTYVLRIRFVDLYGTSTGIITKTYQPVNSGPVIEQVIINSGETTVYDRDVIVNILTKGGTPQVITIGQNPALFPVDPDEPVVWSGKYNYDCQYGCDYNYGYGLGYGYSPAVCDPANLMFGYGYGYDRRVYVSNWCFEDCCETILHTAFDERVPFKLCGEEGEQCIYVRARNSDGRGYPIIKICVTLDIDPPILTVDPVCAELKQSSNTFIFSGTKGVGDSVWINGFQVVAPNDFVVWQHTVTLSSGNNKFTIFSVNDRGRASDASEVNINYEFVFTGIPSALVRADAEGNWKVIGLSLNADDCETQSQVFEIIAETPDQCDVLKSVGRIVYVVEGPLEINLVSPQHRAPVCEDSQTVEFSLTNTSPLKFFGPYKATADSSGNWSIDGVALDPATFTDSTAENMQLIATALNQDGTEHSSTSNVHVQVIENVELQLDGVVLGRDFVPPFNDLNCLELNDLEDGIHKISLVIKDRDGFTTRTSSSFLVDTVDPIVKIISPANQQGVYTVEPPILEYTVQTPTYIKDAFGDVASIPLIRVSVYIDGIDQGEIKSGSRLPELTNGTHTVTVEVETISRDEVRISSHPCDGYGYGYGYGYSGYGYGYSQNDPPYGYGTQSCRVSSDTIIFNYIKPIDIDLGAKEDLVLNVGNNIDKEYQAEAVLEELRVLNRVSSDAEILQDWRLLLNGIRFQNTAQAIELTEEQRQLVVNKSLDSSRISIPDETLVLMHFDNTYQSVPGIDNRITLADGTLVETGQIVVDPNAANGIRIVQDGTPLDLKAEGNIIIDQNSAINQLAIDVFVKKGEQVDEDLIKESIDRIIPARGEALVEFIEVEE